MLMSEVDHGLVAIPREVRLGDGEQPFRAEADDNLPRLTGGKGLGAINLQACPSPANGIDQGGRVHGQQRSKADDRGWVCAHLPMLSARSTRPLGLTRTSGASR